MREIPDYWQNVVLLPEEEYYLEKFKDDPRFAGYEFFFSCEGETKLQGRRFKNLWIHWNCFDQLEGTLHWRATGSIVQSLSMQPDITVRLFY